MILSRDVVKKIIENKNFIYPPGEPEDVAIDYVLKSIYKEEYLNLFKTFSRINLHESSIDRIRDPLFKIINSNEFQFRVKTHHDRNIDILKMVELHKLFRTK